MPRNRFDPSQKYGRWTPLHSAGRSRTGYLIWECRCECGSEKVVLQASLLDGRSKSCGCLSLEMLADMQRNVKMQHGESHADISAEYRCWCHFNSRCHNPKNKSFENYGGRGIVVCDEWRGEGGYEKFLADMGRRPSAQHSIDRRDTDGPYSKANCRWATGIEQQNNKRTNVRVMVGREEMTLAQSCRRFGVDYKLVHLRMRRGWTLEQALTRPRGRHAGAGKFIPPISSKFDPAAIRVAFAAAAAPELKMMKHKIGAAA